MTFVQQNFVPTHLYYHDSENNNNEVQILEVKAQICAVHFHTFNRCLVRPNNEIAAAAVASNIWERRRRTTWSLQNLPTDGGHTRKPMWLSCTQEGNFAVLNERFLPQNRDCTRIGRLCARSCIVPRPPERNPPANRSPKGCRTPKSTCSDGCSTASRTVAAAGDPFSDCSSFGRSENRDQTRNH